MPLTVALFLDGRPGHEKQTRGIIDALRKLTPVQINCHRLKRQTVAGALWSAVKTAIQKNTDKQADLIIGTGSRTHIAMLAYKKRCETSPRLATCMTPDFWSINRFDLIFAPAHDQPPLKENIFITHGPPNTAAFTSNHDRNRGLILLGGIDTKSHAWDNEVISQMVKRITAASPLYWTISSSPRTPAAMCDRLRQLADEHDNITFFRVEETGPGWIEEQYRENFHTWVTADSVSMVYEALSAGCAVGIIPVVWNRADNKFERSLCRLKENNHITTFDDWCGGGDLQPAEPPLREAERCAREILRRFWPERLNSEL